MTIKQIVWQAEYDPFGQATVTTETVTNNVRFPGQYFGEETGLYYNYFRTYDPSLGRYITSDPIGLSGGINTFGYVGGNPLFWTDPYGLETTITITNTNSTANSITGTITAVSDLVPDSYSGDQIQDSQAGSCECKPPLADGTYPAFVRPDRRNRIELRGTAGQGLTNIQIHSGNAPNVGGTEILDGCISPGTAGSTPDWVSSSNAAMQAIMDVVNADGSGNIEVIVITIPKSTP